MISTLAILPLVVLSTLLALGLFGVDRKSLANRARADLAARQSIHTRPTPRIGGIAVAVGILSGALLSADPIFTALLWTVLPIFVVGIVEDFGPDTPPTLRLSVAALSAVLAIFVLGVRVDRLDVAALDWALGVPMAALAFTVFASVGMTHAINLVDGLNGLSSAVVISISSCLGLVAWQYGHSDLALMNAVICAAFFAFLLLNFPRGLYFLGDAGAYSVGHLLAWSAILLLNREPQVSAWGIFLILLWPVVDTLFTIFRRLRAGRPVAAPDLMHYHHVMMRVVAILAPRRMGVALANPIGSALTWPLLASPGALGIILIDDTAAALAAALVFCVLYVTSYLILVRSAPKFRRRPSPKVAA